jgi:flavin reductase (DIM6/NTAB) family NADH-FMN oxidoreductase RutF
MVEAPTEVRAVSDRSQFLAAMRRAAASVSVVTTAGPAGRFGLTVSAMSSVAADPPSLLICINRANPTAAAIAANGVFAVNLLEEGQHEISEIFAGRRAETRDDHLASPAWGRLATGAPILLAAAAVFECRIAAQNTFATHQLFIGSVVEVAYSSRKPLVHHDRNYCTIVPRVRTAELDANEAVLSGLGWGL